MEPLNKGHNGIRCTFPCGEAVLITEGPLSEVLLYKSHERKCESQCVISTIMYDVHWNHSFQPPEVRHPSNQDTNFNLSQG